MAIKFITGVPGAGKTYFAVHHLIKNFCYYNRKKRCQSLKKKYTLISNIDELDLDHLNLKDIFKDHNLTIETFFTETYQKKISQKYENIIYFLDEAQQFFGSRFRNNDVFYYFQVHRHLGHNIYLITQNRALLPKELNALCEIEIRAVKRTLSVFGEFKYNVLSNREIIDRKVLKKSKKVFQMYKSFEAKETEAVKNPFVKYLVGLIIFGCIAGYFFQKTFLKHSTRTKKDQIQKMDAVKSGPSSNSKSFVQDPEHEKMVTNNYRRLSYIIGPKSKLLVLNPLNGVLQDARNLPFKIKIVRNYHGLTVLGLIPEPLFNPNPSPTNNQPF